jgi:hypothetical protein
MSRIILNVATGRYLPYQDRFINSLNRVGYTGEKMIWRGQLPSASPSHEAAPYAFKLYAMQEAECKTKATTILWCDSGVYFVKPPEPLFERIEAEGHFFIIGGDKLGNWCSDAALETFKISRDQVFKNEWQLIGGTVLGFDLTNKTTQKFLTSWKYYCDLGLFHGSYINTHGNLPEDVKTIKASKPKGFVSSDPRCLGHRHDETVGSFLAYQFGMKLTALGDLFQGYASNVVARSGELGRENYNT